MNARIRRRSLRGLVSVRHAPRNYAMGFRFAEQFIITAAHALPRLPSIAGRPGEESVPVYIKGHEAGTRIGATTSVCFADVHSDLAILYNPCDTFASALESLPLRLDDISADEGLHCNIFTSRREWTRALVFLCNDDSPKCYFRDDVPGGTSGAPVFDDSGHVMGIVSASDGEFTTTIYLLNALPGRIIRIARKWNAERE